MGKRGPAPTPTKLKALKGFPGKQKKEYAGVEPEPELGYPSEPQEIAADPIAHAEWLSICEQLNSMDLLTKADRQVIELYCVTYSNWRKSLEVVQRVGQIVLQNQKMKINPYNTVQNQNAKLMKDLLIELGLTPAARARMRILPPQQKDADPIIKLIAG